MSPRLAAVLLGALVSLPALGRECGEGAVRGTDAVTGDAIENYQCAMLGRVYCRVAEDRDAGISQGESARRTADWLDRLNRTGSNVQGNSEAIVKMAAADVFRQPARRPGPIYYRTIYGCGVLKRTAAEPKAQQGAVAAFEAAADGCEKQHALEGKRSYPNRPLRECLRDAVDRIAPVRP